MEENSIYVFLFIKSITFLISCKDCHLQKSLLKIVLYISKPPANKHINMNSIFKIYTSAMNKV